MRLDRFVSQSLSISRSVVAQRIRRGEVTVNGEIVRDGGVTVVLGGDVVCLAHVQLRTPGHRHLMMHKPVGVVSETKHPIHRTVLELLPQSSRHRDLVPLGRLDLDTTGLLLLSTDGSLGQLLLHPRRHVEKAYLATIAGTLSDDAETRFEAGLTLGDDLPCQPARLERLGDGCVRVTLHEGRFHQVKRMLALVGVRVTALHRERIGRLWLDEGLAPGDVRELTSADLDALHASVGDALARRTATR